MTAFTHPFQHLWVTDMRIAIIGAGKMGRNYTRLLVQELRIPPQDIVGHDIVAERHEALASEFGVRASNVFPRDANAAIVAVNTPAHAPVIFALLEKKVPHILCEKPLAFTGNEARRIRDMATGTGVHVYTALVINFSGTRNYLKGLMAKNGVHLLEAYGFWGKPRPLDKNPRPSAGDVEDESVHPIAYAMELMTPPVSTVSVAARVETLQFVDRAVQMRACEQDASFPIEPNSSTSALLTFVDGNGNLPMSCYSSFLLAEQERTVGGVLGRLRQPTHLFKISFDQSGATGTEDIVTLVDLTTKTRSAKSFGGDKLKELTAAFLQAARGGPVDRRLADASRGAVLTSISEAILGSDRRGIPQIVHM